MKKSTHILMAAVLAASVVAFGCVGKSGAKGEEDKPLVVAVELTYPPFETKDEEGNPIGVSMDSIKASGESIGREVRIENTAWDGLIPSLQTGKADMVMSSMTIIEERVRTVDFLDAYVNVMLAVLTNKDSSITPVGDLNQPGMKVATKTGSTGYTYANSNLSNAETIALSDESVCVTEVAQGKADGFIYDQLTTYCNRQENIDTTAAVLISFQDVDKWGIAVQKSSTELLDQLNTFIKEYMENGGSDELTEKYLLEEKEAFGELGSKWFFNLS